MGFFNFNNTTPDNPTTGGTTTTPTVDMDDPSSVNDADSSSGFDWNALIGLGTTVAGNLDDYQYAFNSDAREDMRATEEARAMQAMAYNNQNTTTPDNSKMIFIVVGVLVAVALVALIIIKKK
jgi:hypothetical protein